MTSSLLVWIGSSMTDPQSAPVKNSTEMKRNRQIRALNLS
jgi:hypothetical protein